MNTHQDKGLRYVQTVSILERQPRESLIKLTDLITLLANNFAFKTRSFPGTLAQ